MFERLPFHAARSAVGAICALVVLAGCAVRQPDLDAMHAAVMPQGWSSNALPTGDVVAMEDFWVRWADAGLRTVVERAQAANTDVLTALANLRAARANLTSANSLLWPTADIGADGRTTRTGGETADSYSLNGSAAWTLNLAGSEIWAADAAALEALAAALTIEDVRERVAAEAAQAYVNLRAAQTQYRIVAASIENYRETADIARWMYEAGTGSAADMEDAQGQLASARARLPQIEESMAQYRNALARITVLPADQLPIEAEGALPVPPSGCAVSMPASLLERRADIRSAKYALSASVERLRSAKSNFFPTFSLSGNIGTTAATIGALGTSGTGIAGLVGALSVPVLNWGSLIAQEETAAAQLDSARANYLTVLLGALEETDNALNGISSAEQRRNDLAAALRHAEAAEQLSRLEYETGMGDYSMLLSTQRSLLSAQEAVLTNDASLANNFVMLYRALGGGWPIREVAQTTQAVLEQQSSGSAAD